MRPNGTYTLEGALYLATQVSADILAPVVKLGKSSLVVNQSTTKAQMVANVCDFDGYASIAEGAALAPGYQPPPGGAGFSYPTVQFDYVDGVSHTANSVGFWWLESAGGNVIMCGNFVDDNGVLQPVSMAQNGDILPIDLTIVVGVNAA